LVDLHASELRFPAVEGGRRDAQFPAHVLHLHAGVGLFERVDDLFLGVPALPHEPYPTRLGSRFAWSTFWGQGHATSAARTVFSNTVDASTSAHGTVTPNGGPAPFGIGHRPARCASASRFANGRSESGANTIRATS